MTFIHVYLDPEPNKLKTARAWCSPSMERPPTGHFISLPAQNASHYTVRCAEWNWQAQGGKRSMFALLRPTRLIQPCITTIFLVLRLLTMTPAAECVLSPLLLDCKHCVDTAQLTSSNSWDPQKENMEEKKSLNSSLIWQGNAKCDVIKCSATLWPHTRRIIKDKCKQRT